MAYPDDPRVAEAKAKPIKDVAFNLGLIWLQRGYPEITGHCPVCGGAEKRGSDRFHINLRKNSFYCRKCDVGGDQIGLVRFVRACGFVEALDWLFGPAKDLSAEERDRRAKKAQADADKQERDAARYRKDAIAAAKSVWQGGRDPKGTEVEGYLARRSIDIAALGGFPSCIRFHPALRYVTKEDGAWVAHHEGPAMLAAIQGPDGTFSAVHRTWLDLTRPKGKALIRHRTTGEELEVKKALGSKKGGAIRLTGRLQSDTMVCAEGLETTWSAMVAGVYPGAAFWCLVDKGNMSGRKQKGPGLKYAGLPDLEDPEAFVPPPWVTRLIYVMDGDSEPRDTRASMEAGLRRAMALRPGLQGQIAAAPNGFDLNDVLMGVGNG
jgi:hypothetical protein